MSYAMTFRPGFLDRCRRMSGMKTDKAFAGAIGVSESAYKRAKRDNIVTPGILVGLYEAFGFQPGEVAQITEIENKKAASGN